MTEGVLFERFPDRQEYDGKKPAFVSEYGGIQWSLGSRGDAWGYGNAPKSEQEFIDRYKGLTLLLRPLPEVRPRAVQKDKFTQGCN